MINFINKLGLWFAPYTCTLCLHPAETRDLCASCFFLLPHLAEACATCARYRRALEPICRYCHGVQLPFSVTHALFSYDTPVTKMIMELKFHRQLLFARILGELMAEAIQKRWYYNKPLPELIIPVPLHAHRLRERGYNQALEICRPIRRALELPIQADSIIRVKATQPQARLATHKRRYNMRNAFKINKKIYAKHVAVLDDVITTGETMTELCVILQAHGIEKIDVWCCARTQPEKP